MVFSELVVVGYPPEDLVLKPALQEHAARAVQALANDTADGGPAMIVGAPWVDRAKLYNAMLLSQGGRVVTARYKHDLPNYGVFDEKRVFAARPAARWRSRCQAPSRSASAACGAGDLWQPYISHQNVVAVARSRAGRGPGRYSASSSMPLVEIILRRCGVSCQRRIGGRTR